MGDSVVVPVGPASARTDCAVLVMSSEKYRDLWPPFFTLFWQYWPDCPFPVYLGTTAGTYDHPKVTTLHTGDDVWSKCFRRALERVDTEYVLLFLEDFFVSEPISTIEIVRHLHVLQELDGIVLRLFPQPSPDAPLSDHAGIGRIHPDAAYRVSLQVALWKRRRLLDLIRDEESIWDFELKGTPRSRTMPDGFYGTYEPVISYRHVVERGEWFRKAAEYYRTQPIGCDFTARPIMGRMKTVRKALYRRRRAWLPQ